VRNRGARADTFSRLSKGQVRRKWFPKVTVTVLEPVRLTVDPTLKGRWRRRRLAWRLYEIIVGLGLPHHLDRSHRGGSRDRGPRA